MVYDVTNDSMMVRMLEGVINTGTGTRAAFGRPAAGKTGTTQDWKDAWFVGFTPDWVCGVWVGNDDGHPTAGVTGGEVPAEIWRRMMIAAHQNIPVHDFVWLTTETPAEQIAEDAGQAAGPDVEERGSFYGGLSTDFDHAANGETDHDMGPAYEGPPDRQVRRDRGDDIGPPPARQLGQRERDDYGPPPTDDGPGRDYGDERPPPPDQHP